MSEGILKSETRAELEGREIEAEHIQQRAESVAEKAEGILQQLDELEEPGVEKPDKANRALEIAEFALSELDDKLPSEERLKELLERVKEAETLARDAEL